APELIVKTGVSDLVQESFLEAQQDFPRFAGTSEAELLAWLRRILLNNVASTSRHFRDTGKRQLDREVSISDTPLAQLLDNVEDPGESPSARALGREQDRALQEALSQLPESYGQVIQWRNYERLSFEEIGRRLDRSAEAARKLWTRAIAALQKRLERSDESA